MNFFQLRGGQGPALLGEGSRSISQVMSGANVESEDSSDDTVLLGDEEGGSSTEVEEEDATSAQPAEPGMSEALVDPGLWPNHDASSFFLFTQVI